MVTLYIGALRVGQLEICFILRHLGILRDPHLEISHCSILDVGDIFSCFPSSNGPPFCGASLPLQLFLLGAVSLDKSLLLLPFGVYISTHPFPTKLCKCRPIFFFSCHRPLQAGVTCQALQHKNPRKQKPGPLNDSPRKPSTWLQS